MPAAKARRVAERKTERNRPIRSLARNKVAAARDAIDQDSASEEAQAAVAAAKSALAIAASKGVEQRGTPYLPPRPAFEPGTRRPGLLTRGAQNIDAAGSRTRTRLRSG